MVNSFDGTKKGPLVRSGVVSDLQIYSTRCVVVSVGEKEEATDTSLFYHFILIPHYPRVGLLRSAHLVLF